MATLVVPRPDPDELWPTLGPQVCEFIEERFIFGPGSLKGERVKGRLTDEDQSLIHGFYEVYPQGHQWAGRRRFKRCGYSVRKGVHKTELMAWIAQLELHPESPVRCDGFDAYGRPVGRPVRDPFIPLLAVTLDQVEELAYGALYTMVTEGPDADLFDASLERIIRLDEYGRADGKAVPTAHSPGATDGARTTFQGFDEPHRLVLPRQRQSHQTMKANLPKRPLEDPWALYVGTAGEPGQNSVAEGLHKEAESVARGEIEEPRLFYVHRWAAGTYDLTKKSERIDAIREASGPVPEYGPGQWDDIASQWDDPDADKAYLERVWLNRWTKSDEQAFDPNRRIQLIVKGSISKGSFVTGGFDGARFRDSTGIVITDIATGRQLPWAVWERPLDLPEDEHWEIPEDEVTESVTKLMRDMRVWRFNADPPHWTETVGAWAGKWDCVEEWWTARKLPMARALRSYSEAQASGAVTYIDDGRTIPSPANGEPELMIDVLGRQFDAAGRRLINLWDDDGKQLWILKKLHPERKFDLTMAAVLSWEAYLAALRSNAKPPPRRRTKARQIH